MTDGTAEYNEKNYRNSLFYDLAKSSVIRIAWAQAKELALHGGTALTLLGYGEPPTSGRSARASYSSARNPRGSAATRAQTSSPTCALYLQAGTRHRARRTIYRTLRHPGAPTIRGFRHKYAQAHLRAPSTPFYESEGRRFGSCRACLSKSSICKSFAAVPLSVPPNLQGLTVVRRE
jgi:hypothetical protein